jgi:bifunctional DNA-binding transcriptional regulator/antitoxin component of YhaV-PrlF toxin-antitoxin module
MTVKFKFDYVLNLHNRNSYINYIEKDGVEEEIAFKRSLFQLNKGDIKSITKTSDGSAIIMMKNKEGLLTTVEDYDEIIDTIQKANLALDIMRQEKVYIFDNFEVDDDELNVCESWSAIRDAERDRLNKD